MKKIICISDTHGKHRSIKHIPEGDILIHAGDLSPKGEQSVVEEFINWFRFQPHPHKILIAGNHDRTFDPKYYYEWSEPEDTPAKPVWLQDLLASLPANIHYLENNSVEIDGLKFWGSPITPNFGSHYWAFNADRGPVIDTYWQSIPEDTDVIITHGPAEGKLDWTLRGGYGVGCHELKRRIDWIRPKLHVCGHIHESYGTIEYGETIFVNASIMNVHYEPVNTPIEIGI